MVDDYIWKYERKNEDKERKIPYNIQRSIDLRGLDLTYEERKLKASTFQRPQRAKEREVFWRAEIYIGAKSTSQNKALLEMTRNI